MFGPPKAARDAVVLDGRLPDGVSAKDAALAVVGRLGMAGGTGHVIEFGGSLILPLHGAADDPLQHEHRGRSDGVARSARRGDLQLSRRQTLHPTEVAWPAAVARWRQLVSHPSASFAKTVRIDASKLAPLVTWGTRPDMVVSITDGVPDPGSAADAGEREAMTRALEHMALAPGTPMREIPIDRVFIGSCTNARLEDLRTAARVARGHRGHRRARDGRARLGTRNKPPNARGSTASFARPALNGASPAARCVSA